MRSRLKNAQVDLVSLADYETHLSGNTQFLLDAVLGLINTKQNDILLCCRRVGCGHSSDPCGEHLWNELQKHAGA